MKILIIAGYFPPYCPASASRVNKLARFLEARGHDIHVLCPRNDSFKPVLAPEVSKERIHYTGYTDVNDIPTRIKNRLKNPFGGTRKTDITPTPGKNTVEKPTPRDSRKESTISRLYRRYTNIPDDLVGWYPHGVREGKQLLQSWQPDIIFATLPPFTAMLVANRLGRILDVPVIYDYRDLWTDHPYYGLTGFRKFIDTALENYVLRHCSGLVTVTRTWAGHLQNVRNIPVEFVMNGFDPADFDPDIRETRDIRETHDEKKITLIYAGHLYGDKRDPSVIFEALGRLGAMSQHFKFLLYTSDGVADLNDRQTSLIRQYKLEQVIECKSYIPQKELLKLQQRVDVLVQLRWDDPSEDGVIAGKLFEYIGAGKPILSVGSTTGEAADIVRDNDFGLVSNDADEVKIYLMSLLDAKKAGQDSAGKNPNRDKFTRATQFTRLENFMLKIIAES